MIVVSDDPPIFQGQDGEEITVMVHSSGTVHLVTYTLDSGPAGHLPEGTPLRFDLNKTKHNPSVLKLVFVYTNPNGGSYTVDISGDQGGSWSKTYSQNGIPVDSKRFTFQVR